MTHKNLLKNISGVRVYKDKTRMLMPSKIYMIKCDKGVLGHATGRSSVVFGFLKADHVKTAQNHLKYGGITSKIDDDTFAIMIPKKNQRNQINQGTMQIYECDPLEACINMEINNIKVKLVDELVSSQKKLKLICNFKIDIDIDQSVVVEKLNATFEGNDFDVFDGEET